MPNLSFETPGLRRPRTPAPKDSLPPSDLLSLGVALQLSVDLEDEGKIAEACDMLRSSTDRHLPLDEPS